MNRIRIHNGSTRGFTLLELLIAMTMVAFVALTLAASLQIAFKTRETSERNLEAARAVEGVMDFLRNDLQCAMPPTGLFAGTFEGAHTSDSNVDDLLFYSTAPAPADPNGANGEIKQVELTAYQPGNSTDEVLVRRTLNNLSNQTMQENPVEEVLCRHVAGFSLMYFDGTTWDDTWDSTQQNNSLPMAVQVSLSLSTSGKNPDGSPVIAKYTRIYQFPCYNQSGGSTPTSSGTSSSGTGSSTPSSSGAAGGGAK